MSLRENHYLKLNRLSFTCLMMISKNSTNLVSIFDNDLFVLLENVAIKCLHLRASNHYVERWLATESLHNRAEIISLCITNSQFGICLTEKENDNAPLYHSLATYKILFPRLQFVCLGICLAQFDDSRFDSMLSCYYLKTLSTLNCA